MIANKENIIDFLVFDSEFFLLEQEEQTIFVEKINRKNNKIHYIHVEDKKYKGKTVGEEYFVLRFEAKD